MLTHGEDHPEVSNVDVSLVFIFNVCLVLSYTSVLSF